MPDYGDAARPSTYLAAAGGLHRQTRRSFNEPQTRQPTLQGRIANTRAGKPDPPFGFGKLTTTIAPTSGT